MLKRLALVCLAVVGLALSASAAELTESAGGGLNGGTPATLPATLKSGDKVSGPATIKSASGDVLILGPDSVLEMQGTEEGVELFFLKGGAVRGEIGDKTSVAVPTGWLAVPKGQRTEFYARTMDAARGFFQVRSGIGLVVYEAAGSGRFPRYNFLLQTGQGVEIWNPGAGNVGFLTEQDNLGDVVLSAQITVATEIRLWIPKATAGALIQEEGNKTLVLSEAGSWKGGQIRGQIFVNDGLQDKAVLGPGTFVRIDNITGKVLAFEEVDFEIIQREISLTSEFTAVATSNFFGKK